MGCEALSPSDRADPRRAGLVRTESPSCHPPHRTDLPLVKSARSARRSSSSLIRRYQVAKRSAHPPARFTRSSTMTASRSTWARRLRSSAAVLAVTSPVVEAMRLVSLCWTHSRSSSSRCGLRLASSRKPIAEFWRTGWSMRSSKNAWRSRSSARSSTRV